MEREILNGGTATCRNCGAALTGRYCAECGQDAKAYTSRRVRDVLLDSLDVVFAWDNKIWRSLAALVASPGKLTKEYLDGRIVRYISPGKLFWFLAIVFVALLIRAGSTDAGQQMLTEKIENSIEQQANAGGASEVDAKLFSAVGGTLKSLAPYLMLGLTPVFAFLVRLFYRRRDRYYTDYLIFTLHFFAFFFLIGSLTSLLEWAFPAVLLSKTYENVSGAVTFVLLWIYHIISLRRVFGAKIVPAVFKTVLIASLFLLAIYAVVAVVIALKVIQNPGLSS